MSDKTDPREDVLSGPAEISPREVREMTRPDWSRECLVCGNKPVIPLPDMCPASAFGEAEALTET